MKIFAKVTATVMIALSLLVMCGCNDEPGIQKIDYGKLRIGKMDLSGAVSIGLKGQGNSSRAIDGEYLSAGLYKVDAAGNITAVGVYFTTDTLGNCLEHEEALRVVPKHLFDLTGNYMLVVGCDYYDSDGDFVSNHYDTDENGDDNFIQQDVPYKDLLVRKSDGKIWCVDNIADMLYVSWHPDFNIEEYRLNGEFKEDSHGSLYFSDNFVYKFNLQESSSSFEQITSSSRYVDWFIADNGVIWSPVRSNDNIREHFCLYMRLLWPHSGFQKIDDPHEFVKSNADSNIDYSINIPDIEYNGKIYSDLKITTHYYGDCVFSFKYQPYCLIYNSTFIDNGKGLSGAFPEDVEQYIIDNVKSLWPVPFRLFKLDIGNTPGSVKLIGENIQWDNYPNNVPFPFFYRGSIGSVYEGNDYLLLTYLVSPDGYDNIQCWIARLDWKDKNLSFIKKTNYPINFSNSISYDGKVWVINDSTDNFGAYWFDPKSCEDGFVKFNVTIPSYIDIRVSEGMYNNGKIIYSGQDPSTGNYVKIVIDITTGESVSESDAPEMLFETLINLN